MASKFDEIIQDAITKAEAVKVPMEDFVQGLKDMRDALTERLSIAVGRDGMDVACR